MMFPIRTIKSKTKKHGFYCQVAGSVMVSGILNTIFITINIQMLLNLLLVSNSVDAGKFGLFAIPNSPTSEANYKSSPITQKQVRAGQIYDPTDDSLSLNADFDDIWGAMIVISLSHSPTSEANNSPSQIKPKQVQDDKNKEEDARMFMISIIMTITSCSPALIFAPLNARILKSFFLIAQDKQPMYLFFGAVHIVCISDLIVAVVEGVLLWKEISRIGCEVLGGIQMAMFFNQSLILSTICLYRITAVLKPRRYKNIAKRNIILKIITGIIIFSGIMSILLIVSNTTRFKYLGPPQSVGCSLFMIHEILNLFMSLLLTGTLHVIFILACTLCVLYRFFSKPMTTTQDVKIMRQGALFITSLTTFSYFICYFPTVVVNCILTIDSRIILGLGSPYRLIMDFTLTLLPHIYSCVLPLCLVTGKTLKRVAVSARATKVSTMIMMVRLTQKSEMNGRMETPRSRD